jgi:hypothetical protein
MIAAGRIRLILIGVEENGLWNGM